MLYFLKTVLLTTLSISIFSPRLTSAHSIDHYPKTMFVHYEDASSDVLRACPACSTANDATPMLKTISPLEARRRTSSLASKTSPVPPPTASFSPFPITKMASYVTLATSSYPFKTVEQFQMAREAEQSVILVRNEMCSAKIPEGTYHHNLHSQDVQQRTLEPFDAICGKAKKIVPKPLYAHQGVIIGNIAFEPYLLIWPTPAGTTTED